MDWTYTRAWGDHFCYCKIETKTFKKMQHLHSRKIIAFISNKQLSQIGEKTLSSWIIPPVTSQTTWPKRTKHVPFDHEAISPSKQSLWSPKASVSDSNPKRDIWTIQTLTIQKGKGRGREFILYVLVNHLLTTVIISDGLSNLW